MNKKIIDSVLGIAAIIVIYIIMCITFGASGYRAGKIHTDYIEQNSITTY